MFFKKRKQTVKELMTIADVQNIILNQDYVYYSEDYQEEDNIWVFLRENGLNNEKDCQEFENLQVKSFCIYDERTILITLETITKFE